MAAFGSAPSDGIWNSRADVDGVGEVALFDFGVPVRNVGEIGDEEALFDLTPIASL